MPSLLQLDTCLGVGSTGRIAEIIGGLARESGWHSYMFHSSRFVGQSSLMSYQVGNKLDEYRHYLLSRLFDLHGLGSSGPSKELIMRIEELQPDVVQIHNIHGYYVNYKMLFNYLAEKGIPTVMTMHDFWLMTGHCAYIDKSCDKWLRGCGNCPRLSEYPASLFDHTRKNWALKRELFEAFDKGKLVIVPVSYWLEGYAKQSLLGGCRIQTIQNGVNTKVFKPFEGKHSDLYKSIDWSKQTIITVADRWTNANGFNDIMELSRLLPDDMQIVMVGLNEQQLQGLQQKIVGISHIDNVNQLIELYTAADVLFNASKEVTFGLVTAEAMACGTPAIVFRNTAGEEIIDSHTGYTIDAIGEIPELVYACRKNAEAYKYSCLQKIFENFDSIKQYSKYIELYKSLYNYSEKICG